MAPAARVLVVDDEHALRRLLRLYLAKESYDVVEADNGLDALSLLRRGGIDVALVDVMLPELDGFEVVRRIRTESAIPIILITARGEEAQRIAGLELGADDYVVKPFVVKELAARMRSLLRRVQRAASAPERYVFGELEISPEAGTVTRAGAPVALTKTEFRLLVELVQHAGAVLSRDQLLERIWGYEYLGDGRLVDSHVRRLRTKVERDPSNPTRVITVRGLGYRFEPG